MFVARSIFLQFAWNDSKFLIFIQSTFSLKYFKHSFTKKTNMKPLKNLLVIVSCFSITAVFGQIDETNASMTWGSISLTKKINKKFSESMSNSMFLLYQIR